VRKCFCFSLLSTSFFLLTSFWGFYGHKRINRQAVFCLPQPLILYYKKNLAYIEAASVNPDKRRVMVVGEEARHYIDIDTYGDSARLILPKYWTQAVQKFGESKLKENGIVPWHISSMYQRLRDAFAIKDGVMVLKLSAELGHYIADAHVPLHTTENYNGQLTNQHGIHGFWESRLPELFSKDYNFWVGKAKYIDDPQQAAWDAVWSAHALVDEVLHKEKSLTDSLSIPKYSFEQRGQQIVKVYSREFADAYHQALNGMIEEQMQKAIFCISSFWYSAWIDAGQPDVKLMETDMTETERKEKLDILKAEQNEVKIKSREEN
jgi:hypothetical protein